MPKQEINIEELIGKVYFKIASWHNEVPDYKAEENKIKLQALSFKLIKTILKEVGIDLDEELVEGAEEDKKEEKELNNAQNKIAEMAAKLKESGLL